MHRFLIITALGLAGLASGTNTGDLLFGDGFERCCTVGGEVTGLTASGLVLQLTAGAISETKPITANSGQPVLYIFTRTVPPGAAYTVGISTQPAQQPCTLTNASGTMGTTPVDNINVTCTTGPTGLAWDEGHWDDANWQ